MSTLVSFHAHPDDEVMLCGGTIAKAAAQGHRVVVVMATRGEYGEVVDGVLAPGVTHGEHRTREVLAAARVLGVSRVEFLDYVDSGTMGAPTNEAANSFWQADIEQAAERLAAILTLEHADVLTVYDEVGITGHPDHIQVHRVGVRAAERAGTRRVYEVTMHREQARQVVEAAMAAGLTQSPLDLGLDQFGSPDERITTAVDVRAQLPAKRGAMAAHASQLTGSYLADMPEALFQRVWGHEWFIRRGPTPRLRETSLFDGGH